MILCFGRFSNFIRVFILCLTIQALVITENEVNGDVATVGTQGRENSVIQLTTTPHTNERNETHSIISKKKNETTPKKQEKGSEVVEKKEEKPLVNAQKSKTEPPAGNNITSIARDVSNARSVSAGAIVRGFYVFVGLGAIIVMYIVVRTIRLRRKKTTVRKYGILANREDVEMTPLGAEDEEEDTTLFDMSSHKSRP